MLGVEKIADAANSCLAGLVEFKKFEFLQDVGMCELEKLYCSAVASSLCP